ncbi:MAG: XRE family transcriptional regulator [Tissierellia bacterium]|nr:XRE family transcriptional regulator [Tissierellia bacterium]
MKASKTFINKLKMLMEEKNMSQTDLSNRTGIRQSSISDWLNGRYAPKQDKILLLSEALGVSPGYLVGFGEELEFVSAVGVKYTYPYIEEPVAAGLPQTIEGVTQLPKIEVPDYLLGKYAGNKNIVIMKASGESMNKVIPDGAYIAVLFDYDIENLKNGDIVVFSYSHEYSVKNFYDVGNRIVFRPNSTDPRFTDIIINKDENINMIGKVVMISQLID